MKRIRYVYCEKCGKICQTEIRTEKRTGEQQECCSACGTRLRAGLDRRFCRVCGNALFAPPELLPTLEFPCHGIKPRADKAQEEKPRADKPQQEKPQEDKPQQDKPQQDKPREEKPKAEKRKPDQPQIIEWENPRSRWMVHQETGTDLFSGKPLLQVGADQFAVLESAGRRLMIRPGVSSILRGRLDTRTIIWLVKEGYDPNSFFSSVSAKLFFVDTKEHRISREMEVSFPGTGRKLSIPCTMTLRMGARQIKGLLDQAFDWSSDEEINRQVEDAAAETVQETLKQAVLHFFFQKSTDLSEAEFRRNMVPVLTPRVLTDLANKANRQLCWKGITLSRRLEVDFDRVTLKEEDAKAEEEPAAPAEEKKEEIIREGEFGFFRYALPAEGGAYITGFRKGIREAFIPEEIGGQTVTGIGDEAFAHNDDVASVILSSGVRTIGKRAFIDCSFLKAVTLPDQLTGIGDWAFAQCTDLREITFGKNLAEIGDHAFYRCSSLEQITFRGSLRSIGSYAFCACTGLQMLDLPGSLESIGAQAFYGCEKLSLVRLPAGLHTIGDNAFRCCAPQLRAAVPSGSFAEDWCRANGISFRTPFTWTDKGGYMELSRFSGDAKRVFIPAAVRGKPVQAIGEGCFRENADVQTVELPEGILSIGANAFSRCRSLTKIRLPSTLKRIDYAAFSDCISLVEIHIPGSVFRVAGEAFENCRALRKAVIGSGTGSVAGKCFLNCSSLETLELPETLRKIDMMAFSGCTSLQSVRIPGRVSEIEPSAFAGCASLKSVELPPSVQQMGSQVFQGCSSSLICFVQPGSSAESWCRTWRIRTSRKTYSPS